MNTSPGDAWLAFANGASELDWDRAARSLLLARPLSGKLLAGMDDIREAVFAAAIYGPRDVGLCLRQKILANGHPCAGAPGWPFLLVEGVFHEAVEVFATAMESEKWGDISASFRRLVNMPRVAFSQDVLLEQISRDLVGIASDTELNLPKRVLADDDLGRLGARTDKRLRRLGKAGSRLQPVALALRDLANSGRYERVAADVLIEALAKLHWPTLRHFGWLASAKLPLAEDPRWEAPLRRRSVRALTLPSDDTDDSLNFHD